VSDTRADGEGRFGAAIAAIDAVNAGDSAREPAHGAAGGEPMPSAQLYGQRMSAWLLRLAPDAPEELRLAARAQHIARWKIPRSTYPVGRDGYLAWRTKLAQFHAETAGKILAEAGYGPETIARVGDLLRKRGLKRDPDVQTLEDAACLVFLETQFAAFASKHPDDKIVDILRKTAVKMSARGLREAGRLAERLPDGPRALVTRALG
jgi:hypothetical protein